MSPDDSRVYRLAVQRRVDETRRQVRLTNDRARLAVTTARMERYIRNQRRDALTRRTGAHPPTHRRSVDRGARTTRVPRSSRPLFPSLTPSRRARLASRV